MGCEVEFVDDGLRVTGSGTLHGIDVDLHDVGELTPAVAALCALADAPSPLRGIGPPSCHDATPLAALADSGGGGDIYTSTDSGATWTDQTAAGSRHWRSIASSSDGSHLAEVGYRGHIHHSNHSEAPWDR